MTVSRQLRHFRQAVVPATAGFLLLLNLSASVAQDLPTASIDHDNWQYLLDRYLLTPDDSGIALFNYSDVTAPDKQLLDDYIQQLSGIDISVYSDNEQRAYWINLYNAYTVDLILDNYPVDSIREIESGWLDFGPWDEKLLTVNGQLMSLNDIEHGTLRKRWPDPRIHYAVNCASIGCPNLATRAYTANNLDDQLYAGALSFINSDRGMRFENDVLVVSSIYKWFAEDFGDNRESLLDHLKTYARPSMRKRLENYSGPIRYEYDWGLNEFRSRLQQ